MGSESSVELVNMFMNWWLNLSERCRLDNLHSMVFWILGFPPFWVVESRTERNIYVYIYTSFILVGWMVIQLFGKGSNILCQALHINETLSTDT